MTFEKFVSYFDKLDTEGLQHGNEKGSAMYELGKLEKEFSFGSR